MYEVLVDSLTLIGGKKAYKGDKISFTLIVDVNASLHHGLISKVESEIIEKKKK